MEFVGTGAGALELLGGAPFDVVVTDLRMPFMDGAELLHHVKRDHPGVVRIILSGHVDPQRVIARC